MRRRIVPVVFELLPILRYASESAPEGELLLITGIVTQNLWQDFRVICNRAGFEP